MGKFNIGDTVWYADARQIEKFITCPDCLGERKLTCILGNGERVGFDCSCCRSGLFSSGKIEIYEFDAVADLVTITGMEITNSQVIYRSGSDCCYRTYREKDLFATREEALAKAEVKKAEHEIEEQKRFADHKDQANKDWAYNVTYHRSCIRRFEKDLAYHKSKLVVAEAKKEAYEKVKSSL